MGEVAVDPVQSDFVPRKQTKPLGIEPVILPGKLFTQEVAVDPVPSDFVPRKQTKPFGIEPMILPGSLFPQEVAVDPVPSDFVPKKQTKPMYLNSRKQIKSAVHQSPVQQSHNQGPFFLQPNRQYHQEDDLFVKLPVSTSRPSMTSGSGVSAINSPGHFAVVYKLQPV